MENFNDIKESHKFVERKDILYKHADFNKITLEEIYDAIVNNIDSEYLKLQCKPLYYKVSYPLTSLEVLFDTAYALKINNFEKKNNTKLLIGIDMNMARYKVIYFNKRIGLVSDYCQRWIDYNFPVLYSLKGLYKTSRGEVKNKIYELMTWSKSIDHFLLNYIMNQLGEIDCDYELNKFAQQYNFSIKKFKGTDEEIVEQSLNSWQKIEELFINEVVKMLKSNVIKDTNDLALTRSIENWYKNRRIWNKINDK